MAEYKKNGFKSGSGNRQSGGKSGGYGKSEGYKPDGYAKSEGNKSGGYGKSEGYKPGGYAKSEGYKPGGYAKSEGNKSGGYKSEGYKKPSYGKPRPSDRKYPPRKPEGTIRIVEDAPKPAASENASAPENVVCGRNAVLELLKSGRQIDKILVARREEGYPSGSAAVIVAEAEGRHIPVLETERAKLFSLCGGINHQGVAAIIPEREYSSVDDMLALAEERGEKPLLLIADEIEDPNNLGAIIRTAESAGAHGIIIPKRRSATLTAAVSRASAGALEHFMVARVPNLAQTLDYLKEKGVWIFAAEAGGKSYDECDLTLPCAVILGGEDNGVSRLLREKSDFTVSIPMRGKLNSLNVSAAAAVILYEAVRRRTTGN